MSVCLFCRIVKKEIPVSFVYENEHVIALNDIHPQAKTHILFIHKDHTKNINEQNSKQLGEVFAAIKEFTSKNDLEKTGFRIVTNCGPNGGQTVFHTHFHILGGEQLGGFGK